MNSGSKGLRNSSRPHYFTLSDCIWWACQSRWLEIQHAVIKGTAVFSWIQRKMPKQRYDPLKSSARNSVVTDTAMCLNIIFIRRNSCNTLWSLWREIVFEALHEMILLIGALYSGGKVWKTEAQRVQVIRGRRDSTALLLHRGLWLEYHLDDSWVCIHLWKWIL